MVWTIDSIRTAMNNAGSHWWSKSTMRFWRTRAHENVYQGPGGVYFVTSDRNFDDSRRFTVRRFDPTTLTISSVQHGNGRHTRKTAHTLARNLSKDKLLADSIDT